LVNWLAIATAYADSDDRAAFAIDEQGTVRLFNAASERLLGWRRDQVVGHDWDQLIDASARRSARAVLGSDSPRRVQVPMRAADGRKIVADVVWRAIRGDGLLATVEPVWVEHWLEIDAGEADFGRVLQARGDAELRHDGTHCFEVVAGRPARCDGCPVPARIGAVASGAMILENGEVMIVRARRDSPGHARAHHELLPAAVAARLVREQVASLAHRYALSEREREVLVHLCRGDTVEAIGAALGISPRTAKFHQANVLDKLGVGSRVELMRLVMEPD
jgi:PAS domain S-box-containing protein